MNETYLFDGIRTPIGRFNGSLSPVRADDLAAHVLRGLVERHPNLDPAAIEDVILGCANQAGEDNRNVARMASLLAGLPQTVPGETVNRLCASGLAAVVAAAGAVARQAGDLFIAGGVEHMTRAPFVMAKAETAFSRNVQMFDTSIGWRFINPNLQKAYGTDSMGETAENVALQYQISREDQDRFACHSQEKAARARANGRFKVEILPVAIPRPKADPELFSEDEFIRPETTMASLSALKPAFSKTGSVTAGNASGINDGACALLLGSEAAAQRHQLKPRARLVASAVVGVEPRIMGIGPVEAVNKVLKRAGLTFEDVSVLELNEAFAAQSLACIRAWGLADNDPRINPNGGAIALGHPLGMSGARLALTVVEQLHQTGGRYGIATMCIGVGQGMAALFERV